MRAKGLLGINKKRIALGAALVSILLLVLVNIPHASAISAIVSGGKVDSLMDKVRANAVSKCFTSEFFQSGPFKARDFNDLFTITNSSISNDGSVLLPYLYGNTVKDATISCYNLILGNQHDDNVFVMNELFTGLNSLGFGTIPSKGQYEAIEKFLTAIGYDSREIYDEDIKYMCYEPSYKVPRQDNMTVEEKIGPICWLTKDGLIYGKGKKPSASTDATRIIDGSWLNSKHGGSVYLDAKSDKINLQFLPSRIPREGNTACKNIKKPSEVMHSDVTVKMGEPWSDVVARLNQMIRNRIDSNSINASSWGSECSLSDAYDSYIFDESGYMTTIYPDQVQGVFDRIFDKPVGDVSVTKEFTFKGNTLGALKYFTNLDAFPSYELGELYWMYYYFFAEKDYFNALSVDGSCGKTKPSGGYYIQYYDKNKKQHSYCQLDSSTIDSAKNRDVMHDVKISHSNGQILGVVSNSAANSATTYSVGLLGVEDVLNKLNAINLESYCNTDSNFPLCKATPIDCKEDPSLPGCEDIKPNPNPGPEDGETDKEEELEKACYEHAKSLGWVICPTMFGLRNVVDNTVYGIAEHFLDTSGSVVSQFSSDDSGLYKAWVTFRDMANVIFVLLFMVVIFSQLTGFGIDNYGIKKMLPKIIIAAILINMSYFISGILVDLSNILGRGLKQLFENLGSGALGGSSEKAIEEIVITAGQFLIGNAAVLGAAAGFAFIGIKLVGGWGLIIPILLLLLSIVISGLFALAILTVRQALIVALIVVSPLAFACMILPNTEPIFKKWGSAMKGLLMVYPVVGAVIGASYLTTTIIFSVDNGFFMVIACGILMVGPYFMIPSITKKALSAFGDIGAKISQAGSRLGGGITRFANGTDKVKELKEGSRANALQKSANKYLNRHRGEIEKDLREGNPISASRARAYMRAVERSQGSNKANLGAYEAMLGERETNMKLNRMQHNGLEAKLRAQNMSDKETELSDSRLLSDESMSAWEANLENKAREAAISEQSSLLQRNNVFDNTDEFEKEVYKAATNGNVNRLEALMRKAASGSDKHRESLRKGMDNAFKDKRVNADVARAYGSHLTNNSVYKEKDRSMNDQGTAILNALNNGKYGEALANGKLQSLSNVSSSVVNGKRSVDSVFGYDDSEFDTLKEYAGAASADEKSKIAKLMQDALDAHAKNDNGKYNNIKPETIDQIKKVLGAAGVTNYIPNSGSSSSPTPQPVVSPTTGQPLLNSDGTIYLH